MQLKILQPFAVFAEVSEVLRIVVETQKGSFGLLPQRLDCVAILVPGIMTYETQQQGEIFVAVNDGILVKTGEQVLISVRHAYAGKKLNALRDKVKQDFLNADEAALHAHQVLAKLETGFIRRSLSLSQTQHG
ncbi:F0F1 ATP synthase subunit epsilon [Alteromonadaceae bacterium BrNp21-10]|nr:F0F1 ATP synthase subunit epsilon [Alteromonadaceae bacterium BrNp21-10]